MPSEDLAERLFQALISIGPCNRTAMGTLYTALLGLS